jgi:hypothetical protein
MEGPASFLFVFSFNPKRSHAILASGHGPLETTA